MPTPTKIDNSALANSSITIANGGGIAGAGTVALGDTLTLSIANNAALPGSPTTTTQGPTDDSTNIATTAFVQSLMASPVYASSFNLKIHNNVATPNTKIDFTYGNAPGSFFEVVMENASNSSVKVALTTLTMDAGTTGVNGLDTGSLAANTWYYLFIIFDRANGMSASFASTSTAPTLPSGYTYSALIGAVYTNASAHFQAFTQLGKRVWIVAQAALTNTAPTGNNTYQALSLASIVPPSAATVSGLFGAGTSGTGNFFAVAADANGTGEQISLIEYGGTTAFDGFYAAGNFHDVPLTSQDIYWKAVNTAQKATISVTSWTYP